MLFFAPPEAHAQLQRVFANHQVLAVKINAPGSQIIFS
jgi:D-glycero-alpha-D-manno-heptose-7-phosphate kinase